MTRTPDGVSEGCWEGNTPGERGCQEPPPLDVREGLSEEATLRAGAVMERALGEGLRRTPVGMGNAEQRFLGMSRAGLSGLVGITAHHETHWSAQE